jgi:hypothetical protein
VRREEYACTSAVADLANERDHATSRWRIETVRGFVENDKFRTVDDRLSELRELLHPERVTIDGPVACFAESDVKESFVRTFERM